MSKTYLIATKHAQFAEREYEPDSTIIDPWRYIPHDRARKVVRLGENKPALISVLVPSRGRPDWLQQTVGTAYKHATHDRRVEFIIYLDEDDERLETYRMQTRFAARTGLQDMITLLVRPRVLLSECWNVCAEESKG